MVQATLLSGIIQALMKHQGRAQRDPHYPAGMPRQSAV